MWAAHKCSIPSGVFGEEAAHANILCPYQLTHLSSPPHRTPTFTGPFSQLEAALRLAYAFSECGQSQNKLLSEGQFAELICALHGTDLAQHKHSQVILAYFELSVRYLNLSLPLASTIAATMAGPRGLFHPDLQVRVSAAQSLLRLVERLNAQAIDLLPLTGTFAGLFPLSFYFSPSPSSFPPLRALSFDRTLS